MLKESHYNIEIATDANNRTLLFNTKRESIAWFTPTVLATFHNKTQINPNNILPEIITSGFVVDDTKDEIHEYLYMRHQIAFAEYPKQLSMVIAPTMRCNYNCEYCFESEKPNTICDRATADGIVAFICSHLSTNPMAESLHITWFGGEPLLAFDILQHISNELIKYCSIHKIDYSANIITNGYLLNTNIVRLLHDLKVNHVQITIDGLGETYSSVKRCHLHCFDRVMDNIRSCKSVLPVTVRINVSKHNLHEIKDLVSHIINNVNSSARFYFAPVNDYFGEMQSIILTHEEFRTFKNSIYDWAFQKGWHGNFDMSRPSIRLISCDAMAGKSFAIDPEGYLYKCTHHLAKKAYSVGSVFSGILNNKTAFNFVCNNLPIKCKKCKLLPICAGGCILNRLEKNHMQVNCQAKKNEIMDQVKHYTQSKLMKGEHHGNSI